MSEPNGHEWNEWLENAVCLLHEIQSGDAHVSWGSESWDRDHLGIPLERALRDFALIRRNGALVRGG